MSKIVILNHCKLVITRLEKSIHLEKSGECW